LFTRFYGRCAKNIALDTLAGGGLYIAGGIAAKNKEIFVSKEFLDEFDRAYRRSEFLRKVPLYVILNYDISLLGACYAAVLKTING
jgi:glucokinase